MKRKSVELETTGEEPERRKRAERNFGRR